MRFLHAHGVRGYVTMNTLLFTSELADALTYLGHLNAAGVDGVIVQDIGLARCLTEWGRQDPAMKLELHASTQMTLSSPDGLEFAAGFLDLKQAVLARELSLEEIGQCIRHTDIPLEVFVHGALCVAYSGQCLTSESLGQRSANRGECAQACRLPYTLVVDGKAVPLGERRYLLSPQDLCALDRIPDLVRMGVKSYKIEGRLKSPEYVAAVTAAYRKALDAACAGISVDELVTARDRYALQMVFSRGFSTGWLDGTDHPRLTHGRHGKKRGAYAGAIVDSGNFDWEAHADKFPGLTQPDESYHGLTYTKAFGKMAYMTKATAQLMRDLGSIQSPQNAFLLNLGLETLHLRVPRHCENAQKVAEWLEANPKVKWVNYCGLKSSKYYDLAQKYMPNGSCGVIAFGLNGTREEAIEFMDRLKFICIVTHVADARTCVLHPASHTHRQLTDEQLREAGVAPDLIRLSVGIENVNDIIADIEQALQ